MSRPLTALLAFGLTTCALAQEFPLSPNPDNVRATKTASPPTIDGTINSSEWAGATTSSRALVVIATAQPSGDRAQYWITYDDQYLYVATRILLQNPNAVKADEYRENVSLGGDDSVTFMLDLFGTSQNFNIFSFNSAGATQLQLAGGRAAKREWSGAFLSRGRKTETGWEAEARIEWAIMPMPPQGTRDMKFLFDWYVSSIQRGVSFHSTQGDLTKMHTLAAVEVPDVKVRRTINLLPYAYAGYNDETGEHIANAGLDVKTAINDNLNFVMTLNPDFRNIESEILNLDFSNFERLPGESRPFFQEGSDYLFTGGINNRRLFASQRIGSFDTGLNFYGSVGNTQMGFLGTIDFDNEQTFVGSVTLNPNQNTNVFLAMAALDRPGEENYAGNVEYFTRSGDYLLFAGYQQTDDEVLGFGSSFGTGWQYRARGLTNVLIYEQVTDDFLPRIGFAPQRGFKGVVSNTMWTKSHPRGDVMETNVGASLVEQDGFGGGHYRRLGSASSSVTLRNRLSFGLSYSQDWFLTDVNTFHTVSMSMPRGDTFRGWSLSHTRGDAQGFPYTSTTARVFYRPIKRLQLDLRYQEVEHAIDTDQTVFTMNWEMDRYQSLGGRVVGQGDDWNWFVSYKMSGNLGAEYFLILGDPNATSFQKTLIFKVSVPITIGA